jgi:hypothetical protein
LVRPLSSASVSSLRSFLSYSIDSLALRSLQCLPTRLPSFPPLSSPLPPLLVWLLFTLCLVRVAPSLLAAPAALTANVARITPSASALVRRAAAAAVLIAAAAPPAPASASARRIKYSCSVAASAPS